MMHPLPTYKLNEHEAVWVAGVVESNNSFTNSWIKILKIAEKKNFLYNLWFSLLALEFKVDFECKEMRKHLVLG